MQLDHAIMKNPETAELIQRRMRHNEIRLNQEVAERLGFPEDVKYLDIDTINDRRQAINTELGNIYSTTKPVILKGDDVIKFRAGPKGKAIPYVSGYARKHQQEYSNIHGELPGVALKFLKRYQSFVNQAKKGGTNANKAGRALIRDLGNNAAREFNNINGNKELGKFYLQLRTDLENIYGRRLGGKAKAKWRELRDQQGLLIDFIDTNPRLLEGGKITEKDVGHFGLSRVIPTGFQRAGG